MRKWISLLLALLLCLSLCACQTEAGKDSSIQNNTIGANSDVETGDNTTDQDSVNEASGNPTVLDNQDEQISLNDFEVGYFWESKCGDSGEFWVKATNSQIDGYPYGDVYIWTDSRLIPLHVLDKDDYTICSGIYNGITLVEDEQNDRKIIINVDGDDITSRYANVEQGEQVVGIWEDSTGISVWTVLSVDTYDSHVTTLYAKDMTGNVKMSWSSDEFPDLQLYRSALDEFEYISNGTYMFDQSVIDIKSGDGFCYPPSGNNYAVNGTDEEGNVYTFHNNGSTSSIYKLSSSGDEIWKMTLYGRNTIGGHFSSGLIYVRGQDGNRNEINGFFDKTGNCVIVTDLNISNYPAFLGEYVLLEITNEAGVKFVTLMDKKGNMLFEPIKGAVPNSGLGIFAAIVASKEYYLAKVDDEIVLLHLDGTYTAVPEYWNYTTYKCMQHNNTYFTIEDSQIVVYEYQGK